MNHPYCAEYKHVRIRPLHETDIELLRMWRNDTHMSEFLRPISTITSEMQKKWFEDYLTDNSIVTFAIEEIQDLHRVVGSVAIYNFSGNKAEVGKIVVGDPEAKGKKIGYLGLIMAMYVGYEMMGVETFLGDVHEDNMAAKTNDLRAGFIVTGKHPFVSGGYELEMVLPKDHFMATHDYLSSIRLFKENAQ